MHSVRLGHVLAAFHALAAAIIGCASNNGPTQPASPTKLAFVVQPSTATSGAAISPAIQVAVQDSQGSTVAGSTIIVTLAISSGTGTTGAVLGGRLTQTAVGGVATFNDLTIDEAGIGYELVASAQGLTDATSAAFAVTLAFASVSTGGAYTCGVTVDSEGYCWGHNDGAVLGDGTTTDRWTPTVVGGGLTFAALSGGRGWGHTCGVTTEGVAYCWGRNAEGELGDGTTTFRLSPGPVSGGLTFAMVSAGYTHTCGITTEGTAYCWGRGGLGDGADSVTTSPVAVLGGFTFSTVSTGDGYTCGVTVGGAAYCWGSNSYGELGDSTTLSRLIPVAVVGGLTFTTVSASGYAHACGITTEGAAHCWGYNVNGELGDGTRTQRVNPVAVMGGLTFVTVSVGYSHTCGVTSEGAAYCWGRNSFGELGDGTKTDRWTPTRVRTLVSGGLTFAALSTSGGHSCAVTTEGAAYCWGWNAYGQLGDGTQTDRLTPVRVAP